MNLPEASILDHELAGWAHNAGAALLPGAVVVLKFFAFRKLRS
jgi:hypothetical protein